MLHSPICCITVSLETRNLQYLAVFFNFFYYSCYLFLCRYLQEFQPLGTAGGLYHFRDQISMGDPESFVVLNADMMGDYPLREFVEYHMQHIGEHSVLATEVHSFVRNNFFLQ